MRYNIFLYRYLILLSSTFIYTGHVLGNDVLFTDTCSVNDECFTAIVIPSLVSDQSYTCIDGCNMYASPESIVATCQMGDYPTVWYRANVDANATVINIEVRSKDFESPVISLLSGNAGCNSLVQVPLSNSNLDCIIGAHGVAKAIGTSVTGSSTYYIAVSSLLSIGGDFKLCVSTIAKGSFCVVNRDLQITARSNGGALEGPFDPGEKVSVCMNVNEFTAAGNGCQWFQGFVPVFGNGWDPSSFDSLGQPLNATLNGISFDTLGNGKYGASTWRWFNDVGYHHDNSRFRIGDFDSNGRLDMCNSAYEIDCPVQGGVTGGCCGPCWDNAGDLLPPGWFSYGINGTCPTLGPPIKVDWGDGNTCGGGMGPWSFCFDLVTRNTPDCLEDSTKKDLTLGYYTFADGEIGAWSGSESVCSYDQPMKVSFKTQCGRIVRRDPEILPNVCSGEIFKYEIAESGISTWEWNISPYKSVPFPTNKGENGFIIESPVYSQPNTAQHVQGILIGHVSGSQDVVIRKFSFNILPCQLYGDVPLYVSNETITQTGLDSLVTNPINSPVAVRSTVGREEDIRIYPNPSKDRITVEWPKTLLHPTQLIIYDTKGIVLKTVMIDPQAVQRMEIDIRDFTSGVYILTLHSEHSVKSARMIKM